VPSLTVLLCATALALWRSEGIGCRGRKDGIAEKKKGDGASSLVLQDCPLLHPAGASEKWNSWHRLRVHCSIALRVRALLRKLSMAAESRARAVFERATSLALQDHHAAQVEIRIAPGVKVGRSRAGLPAADGWHPIRLG
jgi:hypothetical protein